MGAHRRLAAAVDRGEDEHGPGLPGGAQRPSSPIYYMVDVYCIWHVVYSICYVVYRI